MKTYWVEIHFKGGTLPLIQHGLTRKAAVRLYDNASPKWIVRRLGDSTGKIKREEKR